MKLEEYGYALNDASPSFYDFSLGDGVLLMFCRLAQALVLDPKYVKAFYRYGEFSI